MIRQLMLRVFEYLTSYSPSYIVRLQDETEEAQRVTRANLLEAQILASRQRKRNE